MAACRTVCISGFVVITAWQQWGNYQEVHSVERLVKVTAIGEPSFGNCDWRTIERRQDNERIHHVAASVRVELRNHDDRPRMLSDIYVEVRTRRRWFWPFTRRIISCNPNIIDNRTDTVNAAQPRRVDWSVEPETHEVTHIISFDRWWDRGAGPKYRTRWDMHLVVAYGGLTAESACQSVGHRIRPCLPSPSRRDQERSPRRSPTHLTGSR